MGFLFGSHEDAVVGTGGFFYHVPQHMNQLFMDGGKRRAKFMGYLGHKFRFHAVDNLHVGDVHQVHHRTQALIAFTQDRSAAGLNKFLIRYRQFVGGKVLIIHMLAAGYLPDELAELLVGDIFLNLLARDRIGLQVKVMQKGRIQQDHISLGVDDADAVGKRFEDRADTAFLGIQVCQGPVAARLTTIRNCSGSKGLGIKS